MLSPMPSPMPSIANVLTILNDPAFEHINPNTNLTKSSRMGSMIYDWNEMAMTWNGNPGPTLMIGLHMSKP